MNGRCPQCGRFSSLDALGDPICVTCELAELEEQDKLKAEGG